MTEGAFTGYGLCVRAVGNKVLKSELSEPMRLAGPVPSAPGRSPLGLDAMLAGRGYPADTVDLTMGANLLCMFRAVLKS